jgi:hypothetical protein
MGSFLFLAAFRRAVVATVFISTGNTGAFFRVTEGQPIFISVL